MNHDGNRNTSDEEVETVDRILTMLLALGSAWVDELGKDHQMTDILVVAPFNAHVGRLVERLEPPEVGVGTVDKFQGQEGPVVVYSMAA